MKLSAWAKKVDVHYQTAHRWHKEGKIVGAFELNGRLFVDEEIWGAHKKKLEEAKNSDV